MGLHSDFYDKKINAKKKSSSTPESPESSSAWDESSSVKVDPSKKQSILYIQVRLGSLSCFIKEKNSETETFVLSDIFIVFPWYFPDGILYYHTEKIDR